MKQRTFSGYVSFSLSRAERDRLSRLARSLGFAHLDPVAADVFRIGLATLGQQYAPAGRFERVLHLGRRLNRGARGAKHSSG